MLQNHIFQRNFALGNCFSRDFSVLGNIFLTCFPRLGNCFSRESRALGINNLRDIIFSNYFFREILRDFFGFPEKIGGLCRDFFYICRDFPESLGPSEESRNFQVFKSFPPKLISRNKSMRIQKK